MLADARFDWLLGKKNGRISRKTNIMSLTENIMLFYREVFPMSDVCGLCSNKAASDVPCAIKEGRVSK